MFFAANGLKEKDLNLHLALKTAERLEGIKVLLTRERDICVSLADRGLKKAGFYVLRHNPHPAILIESLFTDNPVEAAIWREPPFVEALATAVAGGIRNALGLPPAAPPPTARPAASSLSTVQVGAFAYIENARQRLDAYIYQKQI